MARTSSESSSDKAEESAHSAKRASESAARRSSARTGSAKGSGASSAASKGSSGTSARDASAKASSASSPRSAKAASASSAGSDVAKGKPKAVEAKPADRKSRRDEKRTAAAERRDAKTKARTIATPSDAARDDREQRRGLFGGIALFLRQVIAELKKVVTPTRAELFRYTGVVLVFVIIMMVFVTALDLLFGWGASWVFGTGTEVQWPDFSSVFGGGAGATAPPTP